MSRTKTSQTIELEASVDEFINNSNKGLKFNINQILYGYFQAANIPETNDKKYYPTMNNYLNKLVKEGRLDKIAGKRGRYGEPAKYIIK